MKEAVDLLQLMRGQTSKAIPASTPSIFQIGTIPSSYTSGRPTIQFDGESSASSRKYPYLSSYTPAANDRVLLAVVNNGMVILGKIV